MRKVVLVTGGFDPLHSGHIAYLKEARQLGHRLVVGLNSDAWLTRKKGKPFMSWEERATIIKNLKMVDNVISFNDDDGSACDAIYKMLSANREDTTVIFANGGDRYLGTTPEYQLYKHQYGLEFAWGVGGEDKKNSSSWILKEWSQPTTERAWGRYTVLDSGEGWQVKQLAFDTDKALSDQRHFKRSEHWHIVEGLVKMQLEYSDGTTTTTICKSGDSIDIPVNTWHKATNIGDSVAKVIEVWMGSHLSESDIVRRD